MLGAFRGGEGADGGICEPRHCDCCEPAVTVVMVVLVTVSLLFCKAYFRRFERLELEVNWMDDNGNAVEREGYGESESQHTTQRECPNYLGFDISWTTI